MRARLLSMAGGVAVSALLIGSLPVHAADASAQPIQGLWQGQVTCGGKAVLTLALRLKALGGGDVFGSSETSSTPDSPRPLPPASTRLSGHLGAGGTLLLNPVEWIKKPAPNATMLTFDGSLNESQSTLSGTVKECKGGTFTASKTSADQEAALDNGGGAAGGSVSAAPAAQASAAGSGGGFFAQLMQGVKKGLTEAADPVIVRGYILASRTNMSLNPLCLYNLRTKQLQENGVFGVEAVTRDGAPAFKGTGVSLLSCQKAEANGDMVVTNYTGMSPEATPFHGSKGLPSIGHTPLVGLFTRRPYDGTPATEFPRVAITVTDWMTPGCWTARATLWEAAARSQAIPPFTVCWPFWGNGGMAGADHLLEGDTLKTQLEAQQPGAPGVPGASTGNVRTVGPKAPMRATPERIPSTVQRGAYLQFVRALVSATGWIQGAPTNLWIVGFTPEATAN